jgi:hypothetical protein
MKLIEGWTCPICGHNRYEEIFTDNFLTEVETSSEGHVCGTNEACALIGYECTGCTVMFGDPRQFNRSNINAPINVPTKDG